MTYGTKVYGWKNEATVAQTLPLEGHLPLDLEGHLPLDLEGHLPQEQPLRDHLSRHSGHVHLPGLRHRVPPGQTRRLFFSPTFSSPTFVDQAVGPASRSTFSVLR